MTQWLWINHLITETQYNDFNSQNSIYAGKLYLASIGISANPSKHLYLAYNKEQDEYYIAWQFESSLQLTPRERTKQIKFKNSSGSLTKYYSLDDFQSITGLDDGSSSGTIQINRYSSGFTLDAGQSIYCSKPSYTMFQELNMSNMKLKYKVMNGMSEISIGDITSSVNISLLGDQIRFATKNSSISLRGDIKLYVEYSIQPKLKYLPVNDIGLAMIDGEAYSWTRQSGAKYYELLNMPYGYEIGDEATRTIGLKSKDEIQHYVVNTADFKINGKGIQIITGDLSDKIKQNDGNYTYNSFNYGMQQDKNFYAWGYSLGIIPIYTNSDNLESCVFSCKNSILTINDVEYKLPPKGRVIICKEKPFLNTVNRISWASTENDISLRIQSLGMGRIKPGYYLRTKSGAQYTGHSQITLSASDYNRSERVSLTNANYPPTPTVSSPYLGTFTQKMSIGIGSFNNTDTIEKTNIVDYTTSDIDNTEYEQYFTAGTQTKTVFVPDSDNDLDTTSQYSLKATLIDGTWTGKAITETGNDGKGRLVSYAGKGGYFEFTINYWNCSLFNVSSPTLDVTGTPWREWKTSRKDVDHLWLSYAGYGLNLEVSGFYANATQVNWCKPTNIANVTIRGDSYPYSDKSVTTSGDDSIEAYVYIGSTIQYKENNPRCWIFLAPEQNA